MRFISLFSGVGGFDLGLEAAGWQCVAQVEWDKQCQAVLARHWPNVPKWHDVSDVLGADLPAANAVVFGSPCQDLSVAGKRAGFDGTRSVLFYEATRIIREMQDVGRGPTWVIWENVAGALSSSHGRDFGAVLGELADLGALDIGWRVLDAQWFGVPQRRRRVFVVADLAGERAGQVFAQSEGMPRSTRSRSTTRRDIADRVPNSTSTSRSDDLAGCLGASYRQDFDTSGAYVAVRATGMAGYDYGVGTLRAWGGDLSGGSETLIVSSSDENECSMCLGNGYICTDVEHVDCDNTNVQCPQCDARATALAKESTSAKIRRLTPVECERLMGWPDDHTRWRADGTKLADSHRYRMCGNGVVSPVAQWLGERISEAAR